MENIEHRFGISDIWNLNHALQSNPNAIDLKLHLDSANLDEVQTFETIAHSTLPLKTEPFRITIYNVSGNEEHNACVLECLNNANVSFSLCMDCDELNDSTVAAIQKTIESNPNLTNLELSLNVSRKKDLGLILRSLSINNTVRAFKAPCLIETEVSFADELRQLFSENKTLEVFSLNNSDDVEISEDCGQALANNTTLTTLDLYYNTMDSESYAHLAKALRQNSTLQTLNLGFNKMEGECMNEVVSSIAQNTSLTELDLSYNDSDRSGFLHLIEVFQHNTTLTSLDLSYNTMSFLEDEPIFSLFSKGLGALNHLRLSGCGLEPEDISEIGIVMKTNTNMISLSLNNNGISDENAHVLANMLVHNNTLESLSLSISALSDSGFLAIAEGVSMNNTLLFLDLSRTYNVSSTTTLSGLRKIITSNSSLTGLFCDCHILTKQELWVIVDCLFLNSSITRFNMDLCLPVPIQKKVDEILFRNEHNKKMKEMTLVERILEKINHFELTKQTFFDN